MEKNNPLAGKRAEIDALDTQLIGLFAKRMGITAEVAEIKRRHNLAVLDEGREREVIASTVAAAPEDFKGEASLFIRTILALSKSHQNKALFSNNASDAASLPPPAVRKTKDVTCAYQGLPGAWGEQAAVQVFPGAALKNVDDFEDVFLAVKNGEADYGVLPIENSRTGAIGENYDLLRKYGCFIVAKTPVAVRQCLLAREGTELRDIREVCSHPEGFRQCRRFLRNRPWIHSDSANTAVAAKRAAESDGELAAIGSRRAAEHFGLRVLEADIMDNVDNETMFIVIAAKPEYNEASDAITVTFSVMHRSGALCEALMPFMTLGVNLERIESRPGDRGQYRFFADLGGNLKQENMRLALMQAGMACSYFEVLGAYRLEGADR